MPDLQESAHAVTNHITLGFVLGWIFGIIMGITGIVMLFQSGNRTSGEFFILAAFVALPPVQTELKKKAHISLAASLRVVLIIIFFIVAAATLPQESGNTTPTTPPSNAPVADNTDITTPDVYTTVAGQTVYPLKNKYTGDFYIMLDGKPQATGDDGKDDPKQYQALYNNSGPFIRFTSDPGSGHILKVYESFAPVVTSSQLAVDYAANQVAADTKYKGKTIKVSGTVNTIGKDMLDTPYIAFAADDPYTIIGIVQCMFSASDEPQLAKISKGQEITLQGRVKGETGDILIEDCDVVQ